MLIILVGESASGKTTTANLFCERNRRFSRVVTYTTRPPRDKEEDGVDYHFISDADFDKLVDGDYFIEHAKYRDWSYGTSRYDLLTVGDKIVVLTPAGARSFKRYAEKNGIKQPLIVYLNVDRRSRLIKMLKRGDSIDEAYRRNLSDVGQFDSFENESDITIYNNEYKYSVTDVCELIENIIENPVIVY